MGLPCGVMLTDVQAAKVADAQQAAYFRSELAAEREFLLIGIAKRQALIHRPGDAGRRMRASMRSAEAEVRYLERLIAGLDSRFGRADAADVNR